MSQNPGHATPIAETAAPPASHAPREPMKYSLGRRVLIGAFGLLHGVVFLGRERVPPAGPVLVVANHQSYYDPPLIGCAVGNRPLDYLARAGLFGVPLLGGLIRAFHAFPIREDTGDRAALEAVVGRLSAGGAVLLFPEGRRTRTGHVMPLKRGMALVIRRAGCPVLPVAVDGVFDVFPPGRRLPAFGRGPIGVHIGQPIAPGALPRDAGAMLELVRGRIESLRDGLRVELLRRSGLRFPPPLPPRNPPPPG